MGNSSRILEAGAHTLHLKMEALRTSLEVEGSDQIAGLTVEARRLRLTLEGTHEYRLPGRTRLSSTIEMGMRHDGGDGRTGTGAEVGGGLRYANPTNGIALEGRGRALVVHDGGYEDWGISAALLFKPRTDGRGLSFSLRPGYGNTDSSTQKIWQQGLRGVRGGDQDYGTQMDVRLGYGQSASGSQGLLTPYSEMTLDSRSRSYRMGMSWELDSSFNLNLVGERHEDSDDMINHAVLLKSTIRF